MKKSDKMISSNNKKVVKKETYENEFFFPKEKVTIKAKDLPSAEVKLEKLFPKEK